MNTITAEFVKEILIFKNRKGLSDEERLIVSMMFAEKEDMLRLLVYMREVYPNEDWSRAGTYVLDNGGTMEEAIAQTASDFYSTFEVLENDLGDSHD
jgi:hypothetical protein